MGIRETIDVAARADAAARRERLASPQVIQSGRAVRHAAVASTVKFYIVIGAATGDGVYMCYELDLDKDRWDSTAGIAGFVGPTSWVRWSSESTYDQGAWVYHAGALYESTQNGNHDHEPPNVTYWGPITLTEVLNLNEHRVASGYTRGLAAFDMLVTWLIADDESTARRVGVPMHEGTRLVKATEAAPSTAMGRAADSGTSVTCNLQLADGTEAQAGDLGYEVEVYGLYEAASTPDWDEVVPDVRDGMWAKAAYHNGVWYFEDLFRAKCMASGAVCAS